MKLKSKISLEKLPTVQKASVVNISFESISKKQARFSSFPVLKPKTSSNNLKSEIDEESWREICKSSLKKLMKLSKQMKFCSS